MTEMVDVGLSIQGDAYLDTMGQAVAITRQYVNVADNMAGSVGNLNQAMVGLTQKITGFNKTNTVALDQAAAYQKALSGIEAKAAVTGKSFTSLEKTTKSLGKSWGGDMAGAIKTVEALQASGIKSEQTMARLGKAYMNLGAATGTVSADIGTQMLQMSRTFGNGAANFEKLSDSLVGVTSKIGGSASSVVAFSKALAPVASTVGIGQTAIMGLSTAMSSLGEDGYRSANTFNKVMLDMNRTLRDGGPELKAYADIIGTTSDRLAQMWKQDPAEVLTRFSEAVAKQGPGISRQLDALGFDSVRDTRALTALSRAGGPRQAIAAAVSSYGDGSTATAAEIARGGVMDTAGALQESMSQVVGDLGAPMLGIAEFQLKIAKSVSDLMGSITSSGPGQAALKVAGVGSLAGSAVSGMMTTAAMVGLGNMGFNFLKGRLGAESGFGAGRAFAMQGEELPDKASRAARAGWGAQMAMSATSLGPAGVPGWAGSTGWGARLAARGAGVAADATARGLNAWNTNWLRQLMGQDKLIAGPQIPGQHRAMWQGLAAIPSALFRNDPDARDRMAAGRMAFQDYSRGYGSQGAFGRLGQAAVMGPYTAGRYLTGKAMQGIGLAGAGLAGLGISGPMLGIGAAIGGGMYLKGQYDTGEEALGLQKESSNDIFSSFNDFANAAGTATRGLVAFSQQVENTTSSVVASNTTMEDAYKLTQKEIQQAESSGYKAAFTLKGDVDTPEQAAAQAAALLGRSPSPQDMSRVVMDVAAEKGADFAQSMLKELQNATGTGYESLFGQIGRNSSWTGFANDAQTGIGTLAQQSAQQSTWLRSQNANGTKMVGGVELTADEASRLLEFTNLYEGALAARKSGDLTGQGALKTANLAISEAVGLTEKQQEAAGITQGYWQRTSAVGSQTDTMEVLRRLAESEDAPDWAKAGYSILSSGQKIDESVTRGFMDTPEQQKETQGLLSTFSGLSKAGSGLVASFYGAENSARALEETVLGLTATEIARMDEVSAALARVTQNPNDQTRYAAGQAIVDAALKDSGGSPSQAMQLLDLMAANTQDGPKADALGVAKELLGPLSGILTAGQTQTQSMMNQMMRGMTAQGMPRSATNTVYNQALSTAVYGGQQAQAALTEDAVGANRSFGALGTSISQARRSAGVAAGGVARDLAINLKYAQMGYEMNRRYSEEDYDRGVEVSKREYNKSVRRSTRDFQRADEYAVADYNTTRVRAEQDFFKQQEYALQDHNRQKLYATEDYEKSRVRAVEDYNLQVSRANRDFAKQETRAIEDYNRSRTRAQEDFNKSMKRMTEDSAKTLYDPYKRMAAKHVMDMGQLLTNLADQQKAMEKQISNVDALKGMGLSKEAIQQLGLMDSNNAQQVSRLLADAQGNTGFIDALNQATASRTDVTKRFVQNEGNVTYDRAQEDFATSQRRGEEDFNTSMTRSRQDFATSMVDAEVDFTTAMKRSAEDFEKTMLRTDEQFKISIERSFEQYTKDMTRVEEDFHKQRGRTKLAHDTAMADMRRDHNTQLSDMAYEHEKQLTRMEEQYEMSVAQMKEKAAAAMAQIGAGLSAQIASMYEDFFGVGQNSPEGLAAFPELIKNVMSSGIDPESMSDEWQSRLQNAINMVAWNDMKMPAGYEAWLKANGLSADARPSQPMTGNSAIPYTPPSTDVSVPKLPDPPDTSAWDDFWAIMRTPIDWEMIADFWWPDDWEAMLDPAWPDNWDFLSPDIDWESIGDNLMPDNWDFLVPDVDWTGFADRIWPDNWDFLAPDVTWDMVLDAFWPDNFPIVFDADAFFDAVWPDNWDFLFPDFDWAPIMDSIWPDDWGFLPDLSENDFFDGVWPDEWDFLFPDFNWSEIMDNLWPDSWGDELPDLDDNGFFDGLWPDSWGFLTPDINWRQIMDSVLNGENGEGGLRGWIRGIPDFIRENIPGAGRFEEAFGNIVSGFRGTLRTVVSAWNDLDFKIDFDAREYKVGGFKAGPWDPFPGIHIKEIGWDGATIHTPSIHTGDLIPDIPNPFALGGIATRQMTGLIAEAGYPEAVIPLNQRGADVLAATMARYIDSTTVRGSQVQEYSTQVVNYNQTYDYRTQFTGPVSVQAQDPDEMAQKLAARQRRQRLAQPVGGAR